MKYRLKIKNIINNQKNRNVISKVSDIWWVISLVSSIISLLILIFWLLPLSAKIDNIADKISQDDAKETLMTFFSLVESDDLSWAYNLFSQSKKQNNPYPWFELWLKDLVWFEWLQITSLSEKDTAIKKVFLVEYTLKKRGMKWVDTKQWYYLKYSGWKWYIDYSTTPLYENWRKDWACEFYKFDNCY